jgi:hypothetical protein
MELLLQCVCETVVDCVGDFAVGLALLEGGYILLWIALALYHGV